MDIRPAPAECFDLGVEFLERVKDGGAGESAYLGAIAWFLAGLLRNEMT